MRKLFLLAGPAGSGKSSWIKKRLTENDVWISRDVIRLSLLQPGADLFDRENEVVRKFYNTISEACENEAIENIYVDATHLSPKVRRTVMSYVKGNIERTAVSFEIPWGINVARNAQRSGHALVPEKTIADMRNRFVIPTLKEGFDHIIHVNEKGEERYE